MPVFRVCLFLERLRSSGILNRCQGARGSSERQVVFGFDGSLEAGCNRSVRYIRFGGCYAKRVLWLNMSREGGCPHLVGNWTVLAFATIKLPRRYFFGVVLEGNPPIELGEFSPPDPR